MPVNLGLVLTPGHVEHTEPRSFRRFFWQPLALAETVRERSVMNFALARIRQMMVDASGTMMTTESGIGAAVAFLASRHWLFSDHRLAAPVLTGSASGATA